MIEKLLGVSLAPLFCFCLPGLIGLLFLAIYWLDRRRKKQRYQNYLNFIWQHEDEWGAPFCQKVQNREVTIGMTPEMVVMAWGKPNQIDQQIETQTYYQERWIYGQPRQQVNYITFRNNLVYECHLNFAFRPVSAAAPNGLWIAVAIISFLLMGVFGCPLTLTGAFTAKDIIAGATPTRTPRPTKTPVPTSTPIPTPTVDIAFEKQYWQTVDIRDLVKNPKKYTAYQVHYLGEIFKVSEDAKGTVMQVWVNVPGGNEFDREAVIVVFNGNGDGLYEKTKIELWGYGAGSFSGTNAMGGTIEQPLIKAEYITYFK